MKIKVWAQTRTSSSRVETTVEIDDEDAEDEELLDQIATTEVLGMIEWGCEVIEEEDS